MANTKSKSPADAVREAAAALKAAIGAAKGAGFVVVWPYNAEGLDGIAVSETAKVVKPTSPAAAEAKLGD